MRRARRTVAAAALALWAAPPTASSSAAGAQDAAAAPGSSPAAPERAWDALPALVWRSPGTTGPLPPELLEPFGGANVERAAEDGALLGSVRAFYVGHGPGRDALHLERDSGTYPERWSAWLDSRDSTRLVRDPCLTDPATRRALVEELDRTLAARGGRHGLGVSLGDEVSLTPWGDPVDLCRSPTCERAWRELAGADAAFPDTDTVRRAVARGETEALGPWLARRRFHHDVLVHLLEDLAARVRERAPGTAVGLLGLTGTTAFGGVDVARLLPTLDFLEVYPTRDARELLFTLRDRQRALCTVILEDSSPASCAWQVWEHWLRGGDGWILYRERDLLREEEPRAALARAVRDVRAAEAALRGRGLERDPVPAGAAVVHSNDARSAAWLRDALRDGPTWPHRFAGYQARHGTREQATQAWLRLFEDAGALPGAVPLAEVGAATVERFPLLVLVHVVVLAEREREGLRRYLAAGGRLVVDGDLGWVDERGARPAEAPAEELARAFPDSVRAAPDALSRYLRERTTGSGEGLRATARRWLAETGSEVPPCRLTGDSELPWLAGARNVGDTWVLRAVPNLQRESERRGHLEDGPPRLAVAPGEGWEVEWVHPAPEEAEPPTEAEWAPRAAEGYVLLLRRAGAVGERE